MKTKCQRESHKIISLVSYLLAAPFLPLQTMQGPNTLGKKCAYIESQKNTAALTYTVLLSSQVGTACLHSNSSQKTNCEMSCVLSTVELPYMCVDARYVAASLPDIFLCVMVDECLRPAKPLHSVATPLNIHMKNWPHGETSRLCKILSQRCTSDAEARDRNANMQ